MADAFNKALKEIQRNLGVYETLKDELEEKYTGKVALFHHGNLVGMHDDYESGYEFGCEKFGLGDFSLKQIGEKPISLGAMTPLAKSLA